jgi:hypothetical protein
MSSCEYSIDDVASMLVQITSSAKCRDIVYYRPSWAYCGVNTCELIPDRLADGVKFVPVPYLTHVRGGGAGADST